MSGVGTDTIHKANANLCDKQEGSFEELHAGLVVEVAGIEKRLPRQGQKKVERGVLGETCKVVECLRQVCRWQER